ncbi:substrate-binding periplasmic protein [Oligoflexus tunisiensis]|uniref:substrate-binding periplasmic protein n=1 Tax=Oligoflexus tunisiensis TaxID=708132 RepID=UPI00114CD2E7|nr:hypothetical protein [Oligoflexus tunisiensis]
MRALLLSAFFSMSAAAAESRPAEIRVCFEDKQAFPLYNTPGLENSRSPGILIDFIRHVTQKHGLKLNLVRRPPSACRILMKSGTVDAYGIISHIPHREDWAVYPHLADGAPDTNRAFKRTGYFLYGRTDKDLPWDGRNLTTLKGLRIGSSDGYSINEELIQAGAVVETFKSVEAMYTRLVAKQLDGVAQLSNRIDRKLDKGVRKYAVPLKMNDYYFTFSKEFYADHKELCEMIWKDSVLFEESPEGRRMMMHYEALGDFPKEEGGRSTP